VGLEARPCEADAKLDRSLITKVMTGPKLEMKAGMHKVFCNLEQADWKKSHKLTFAVDPIVTFEKCQGVKASLNWCEVDGTTLAKTALCSATAVDHTFKRDCGRADACVFAQQCDEALKP
jgi:hypothetical protein